MQNVLVKQCLSELPNAQVCLSIKIRNVCQAMLVHLARIVNPGQTNKHCVANIRGFACQAQGLSVWPSHKHVLYKIILLLVSKKMSLKLTSKMCLSWCPNAQACLPSKIRNVCPAS